MKKFFLTVLSFFTFTFSFAEFNDGKTTKYLEFDLSSSTTRGMEKGQNLYAGQAGLKSYWYDAEIGSQAYEDAFDLSLAGIAWLPFTDWNFETSRIALGVGALYHFQRYKDISSEHDYMIESCFRYQNKTGFTLTFHGGYSWKTTRLDELAEYVPLFHDHYPELGIMVDKIFLNGFELYFEHATHDFYRYPVFCSPEYTLGLAINLESGLRFGGEAEIRFVDQYTTAPYCDSLILRMTARYSF